MSDIHPRRGRSLVRTLQKFVVSGFVIFAFGAYALHEHLAGQDPNLQALAPRPKSSASEPVQRMPQAAPTVPQVAQVAPTTAPSRELSPTDSAPTPAPTSVPPTAKPPVPASTQTPLPAVTLILPDATDTEQAPTDTPAPTATEPARTAPAAAPTRTFIAQYQDGAYTGPQVDAVWGLVHVRAVIQGGKLTAVQILEYPNDRRTSVRINQVAIPDLQSEAIQAQSARVDIVTGATLTSEAFMQSLQGALASAKGLF